MITHHDNMRRRPLLCLLGLIFSCTADALRVCHPRMLAGFGAATKSGGKKKGKPAKTASPLSPKRQWERFKAHRSSGIEAVPVYARVRGGDGKWLQDEPLLVRVHVIVVELSQTAHRF